MKTIYCHNFEDIYTPTSRCVNVLIPYPNYIICIQTYNSYRGCVTNDANSYILDLFGEYLIVLRALNLCTMRFSDLKQLLVVTELSANLVILNTAPCILLHFVIPYWNLGVALVLYGISFFFIKTCISQAKIKIFPKIKYRIVWLFIHALNLPKGLMNWFYFFLIVTKIIWCFQYW